MDFSGEIFHIGLLQDWCSWSAALKTSLLKFCSFETEVQQQGRNFLGKSGFCVAVRGVAVINHYIIMCLFAYVAISNLELCENTLRLEKNFMG